MKVAGGKLGVCMGGGGGHKHINIFVTYLGVSCGTRGGGRKNFQDSNENVTDPPQPT